MCSFASREELLDAAMYSFGITIDELRNAFIPTDAPEVQDEERLNFQMRLAESQRRRFIKLVSQEARALGDNRAKYERVKKLMVNVGRRGSLPLDVQMVESCIRFNESSLEQANITADFIGGDNAANPDLQSQREQMNILEKNLQIEKNRLEKFKQQEQQMLQRSLMEDVMFMERQNTYRARMSEKEERAQQVSLSARQAADERKKAAKQREIEAKERYQKAQESDFNRRVRMENWLQEKSERTNAMLRAKAEALAERLRNRTDHWAELNERREQNIQDIEDHCRELLKKIFIKKIFGLLARCDFWLKLRWEIWSKSHRNS